MKCPKCSVEPLEVEVSYRSTIRGYLEDKILWVSPGEKDKEKIMNIQCLNCKEDINLKIEVIRDVMRR